MPSSSRTADLSSSPFRPSPGTVSAIVGTVLLLGVFACLSGMTYLSQHSALAAEISLPLVVVATLLAAWLAHPIERDAAPALHVFVRALALVALAYIALQRPLFPNVAGLALGSPLAVDVTWIGAMLACIAAWRLPVLIVIPGFYLSWIKALAGHAAEFPYDRLLDILPLSQLSIGAGVTLAIVGLGARYLPRRYRDSLPPADRLLFVLLSFHFAGYLWSGIAKGSLEGGFLFWPLENQVRNIYFAGIVNQQLPWQEIPGATALYTHLLALGSGVMGVGVFMAQLAAFSAFLSRRWAILLLLVYDVMHIGIFVSQGANFGAWVLVNLCIIAAIRKLPAYCFGTRPMLLSVALMVCVQLAYGKFYRVPRLGWYDTLAVNNAYFVAVTDDGERHRVPIAFFGFYSYPISHMSFGKPPGGTYVPTNTNGNTRSLAVLEKASDCSFAPEDLVQTYPQRWDGPALRRFVREQHATVLEREKRFGWQDYTYWHHFWSPPSVSKAFDRVDLRRVTGYEHVIEATCIEPGPDGPLPQVIATERFEIPLEP